MSSLPRASETLDVPIEVILQTEGRPKYVGAHIHALGRNVVLKYVSETSRLFQLAFFVVIARRFGPSALGILTVLLMIGSSVGLFFGDLGINTAMIARMSGRQVSEQISEASQGLFWKNVLCAVAFVVMCGGMYLARNSTSPTQILAIAVISVGGLWFEFLSALTNGLNRFDAEVWLRLCFRGVVYGGGALLALFGSLTGDLVYMAGATIAVLVGGFLIINKRLVPLKGFVRSFSDVALLKSSVPVWITQLAQLTYLKFDVVILGLLHVAALETGWYAAAWKVADVLTSVPALLSAAVLPLLCGHSAERNISLIAPRYLKIMYVLPSFFALPLAIGAGWITHLLYGQGFTGTPRILRILVWAIVPIFVHAFLAVLAVATRRQSEAAKLAAATSIIGILAAVISVPRFGYEAMAIICLVANSIFACAMIYRFRDATGTMQLGVAVKSLTSALAVYGFCSLVGRDVYPVVLVLGGVFAYVVALFVFGVINTLHLKNAWQFTGDLFWNRGTQETNTI